MSSNFSKALKDLTGFDGKPVNDYSTSDYGKGERIVFNTEPVTPDPIEGMDFQFNTDNATVISSTMKITGDIKSENSVKVEGKVFGNIHTNADLFLNSLVVGDVKANNAALNSARLQGKTQLKGNSKIDEKSVVVGDIFGENIELAGKVKGDVNMEGVAVLCEESFVLGNIVVESLSTKSGARINGTVTMKSCQCDDDLDDFDFGGEF